MIGKYSTSAEGAECNSPGREPGDLVHLKIRAREAGDRDSFAPTGLAKVFFSITPGLRPGLLHSAPLALKRVLMKFRRDVFPSPFQRATHPDEFIQKILGEFLVKRIQQFAFRVKRILDLGKVQIGERNRQTQLAHHRHH